MATQPDLVVLLTAARDTFLEVILPQIPAAAQTHGEDVALALSIALRDLKARGRATETGLTEIYPETQQTHETNTQRLAGEIRAGRFDDPGAERTALLDYLRRTTAEKLAIDNPEYD